MIDNFSIALTHGLMLLIALQLYFRADLDDETPPKPAPRPKGWNDKGSKDA